MICSTVDPTPPFVFDVQIKAPGDTAFRDWKLGLTVRKTKFFLGGKPRGTYR